MEPAPRAVETKPWYLEDDKADEQVNPFAHRQRLPALPDNPPPILESLLKCLSIDVGLDYLNLLDLRSVDPPPAFGANLFMIFGTARGNKHLYTSADHICRWLRSNYKLRPYADGLLGRQEMKLINKRKTRRARMLSAAGDTNPMSLKMDDGTGTGWVCVNVGEVETGVEPRGDETDAKDDFVGFGRRSENAKIVIQMMTEEKRVELDLESLWQEVARRSSVRKASIENAAQDPLLSAPIDGPSSAPKRASFQQRREMHTSSRNLSYVPDDPDLPADEDRTTSAESGASRQENKATDDEAVIDDPVSKFTRKGVRILDPSLATILNNLSKMDNETRILALGKDQEDRDSTATLQDFFSSMPPIRSKQHWSAHLYLHRMGIDCGHEGYTVEHHWRLLQQMDEACIPIPAQTFLMVLETILRPKIWDDPTTFDQSAFMSGKKDRPGRQRPVLFGVLAGVMAKHHHMAFDVLERMEAHGHDPLPFDFLIDLQQFALRSHASSRLRAAMPTIRTTTFQEREYLQMQYYHCLRLLFPTDKPLPGRLVEDLVRSLGESGFHSVMLKVWRGMALEGHARSAAHYASFFTGIARAGDPDTSLKAIADYVPDMEREETPVKMDEGIAVGILGCLRNMGYSPHDEDHGHLYIYEKLWNKCWGIAGLESEVDVEETKPRETGPGYLPPH